MSPFHNLNSFDYQKYVTVIYYATYSSINCLKIFYTLFGDYTVQEVKEYSAPHLILSVCV